jgi:hypothetical protein
LEFQQNYSEFNLELVFYDEVELFRDNDDELFEYPYVERKNKISSITFTPESASGDYTYFKQSISLQ